MGEVSLEVAPDTVDAEKLKALRDAGINRVNLGLQSADDLAIQQIGRRHDFVRAKESIENAMKAGFDNVCVDLIYGLPGQNILAWEASVAAVIDMQPHTICAYPLTRRPYTGFSRISEDFVIDAMQYEKYSIALSMLDGAGYKQETHVRYVRDASGGYRQKANHWAGQDIIGVGAGGRGYLRTVDYRNGYSVRNRKRALTGYIERVEKNEMPYDSGFQLTPDEQIRRSVVLGLMCLDRTAFKCRFKCDVIDLFPDEFAELDALGLVRIDSHSLRLSPAGMKYRDIIVLKFFSDDVWNRILDFDYSE